VVAYRGHLGATWTADWAPFSFYFATGGADRTARLWATEKSAALRLFAGHTSHVDVCLSLFLSHSHTDIHTRILSPLAHMHPNKHTQAHALYLSLCMCVPHRQGGGVRARAAASIPTQTISPRVPQTEQVGRRPHAPWFTHRYAYTHTQTQTDRHRGMQLRVRGSRTRAGGRTPGTYGRLIVVYSAPMGRAAGRGCEGVHWAYGRRARAGILPRRPRPGICRHVDAQCPYTHTHTHTHAYTHTHTRLHTHLHTLSLSYPRSDSTILCVSRRRRQHSCVGPGHWQATAQAQWPPVRHRARMSARHTDSYAGTHTHTLSLSLSLFSGPWFTRCTFL
jgi:hypothetical protein